MKSDHLDGDPALSCLLREWQPAASLRPRFEEVVWQRIARTEPPAATNRWADFREWLDVRLRRPAMARACVAVLMGIGLTTGYLHARADAAQAQQESQARYLQSVDPFRR